MKIFFDLEFMEEGHFGMELLSIGAVREDGAEYYAENRYANLDRANPWVKENVIPYLAISKGDKMAAGGKTPTEIAIEFRQFAGERPEFWAYYGAYDWVILCQLYGRMIDLPVGWPMFCMDIKQLAEMAGYDRIPRPPRFREHHALDDARWNQFAHGWLVTEINSRKS